MGPLESEFDHTLYTAEFVTAEPDQPLATILERVEDALARTPNVVLILPRGSTAFHSTHDFLALGKLHSGRDVHVSIASPDPTIASLARVLGFYVETVPDDHDYYESPGSVTEEDTEQPTSPLPLGPPRVLGPFPDKPEWVLSPSGYVYPVPSTTSTWLNHPSDPANAQEGSGANGNGSKPAHPHLSLPLSRSGVPAPRTKPRATGQLQPTIITDPSLPSITGDRFDVPLPLVSTTESGRIKARRTDEEAAAYVKLEGQATVRKIRRFTALRVVTGVLVLLLLALVGAGTYAWIYLPEGSVEITPLKKDLVGLQIEVPVLITPGAAGRAGLATPLEQTGTGGVISTYSLTSTQRSVSIVEEGTAPATGSRTIAKGRGEGVLHFTNRTSNPITIARGMQFKSPSGVVVEITQGGVLPPTIFGASFGQVDLQVAATVEGPDGNIPAEQIRGVSDNGAFEWTNRAALQGGGTETLKVVTQQDIDTLMSDLKVKALDQGRALGLLLAQVPPGHELITQTVKFGEVTASSSLNTNQDGEAVTVVVTTSVQAFSYNKGNVQKAVYDAIRDQVDMMPDTVGPVLDENTIRYEPPAFQAIDAAQGRITYSTSASARVNFTVTPTLKEQIRVLVTGKEIAKARSLISERYGEYVNASAIQANVLWLNIDKLPSDSTRITIDEGPGVSYVPALSSPGLRPDPSSQR